MHGLEWEVVKELPPVRKPNAGSRYQATIGEFLSSGAEVVKVDCGLKAAKSVYAGLRQASKAARAEHLVYVAQRGDDVFLVRKAGQRS